MTDCTCTSCNGTGEGAYDGATCHDCRGTGECPPERDPDDFVEPEPDYYEGD